MEDNRKTVSDLLREAASVTVAGSDGTVIENIRVLFGIRMYDAELFRTIADRIDAELYEARCESLRRGAEIWAKANGWPDFRDGEDFGAWLYRCAIKRPLFEDGEPVQVSDIDEIGALANCCVFMDGSWHFDPDKYEYEGNPKPWDEQRGAMDKRIKRPAKVLDADGVEIKVGDAVWNINNGCEHEVIGLPKADCYQSVEIRNVETGSKGGIDANLLTHEKHVFDAEGVRIRKGDTVWHVCGSNPWKVVSVDSRGVFVRDEVLPDGEGGSMFGGYSLTHKEPDSLEKLRDDVSRTLDKSQAVFPCGRQGLEEIRDRLTALMEREESHG